MVQRFKLSASTRRELDKVALALLGGPDLGGDWNRTNPAIEVAPVAVVPVTAPKI